MRKIYLLFLVLLLSTLGMRAQINASYTWESGLEGWASSGLATMETTTVGCFGSGGAVRTNLYLYYNWWDDFEILYSPNNFTSPLLANSTTDMVTVSLSYRAVDYSSGSPTNAAPTGSFNIKLQWSSTSTGPWTDFGTPITMPALECTSYTATFTPGTGDVYIRLVSELLDDYEDIHIYFDELNVTQGPPPACLAPTAGSVTSISSNSVSFTWGASASLPSDGYQYEVRTDSNPGVNNTALIAQGIEPAGTLDTDVAGLSELTTYRAYVRANCGGTGYSSWVLVASFTTTCAVQIAPTTLENFSTYTGEITSTSLPCWQERTAEAIGDPLTGTTSSWGAGNYNNSSSNSNGNALYINLYGTDNEWMISPSIDLGTASGPNFRLKYDASIIPWSSSSPVTSMGADKSVSVLISTDNGLTWSTTNVLRVYDNNNIPYGLLEPEIIDLSAYSGVVKFAFFAKSTSTSEDFRFYIDNFVVEPIPACPDMPAFILTDITKNTAEVSWTALDPVPGVGYEYELRTSGAPGTPGAIQTGIVTSASTLYEFLNLLPSTEYFIYFRTACSATQSGLWSQPFRIFTLCDYPDLVSVNPGTRCGVGVVNLSATYDAGVVNWYESETSVTPVGSGTTFTTPILNQTTSYWVSSSVQGASVSGGKSVPDLSTSTTASDYGLVFDAFLGMIIETVDVYLASSSAGSVVINLTNSSGTVIDTRTVAVPAGDSTTPILHTISLNFNVPAGVGYRLIAVSSPSMVRESSGNTFPYAIGNLGSITGGYISGASTNYYYFYNWVVKSNCSSPRTEVEATLTSAPVLTLSNTSLEFCEGQTSTLTVASGASDYDTFVWSPSTGVVGDVTNGWIFSATESTVYTLTATQTSNQCVTVLTLPVTVNPLPDYTPLDVSYTTCVDQVFELNPNISGTAEITVGTDLTLTGSTDNTTAFNNRWTGSRQQYIYTKDELNALGFEAGNISGMAFEIATLGSAATNDNYTIKIAAVTTTDFADSNFLNPSFVTVFGPMTYTHNPTGWHVFDFTTSFTWDGISNVLVQLTHEGADSLNNSQTYYTETDDYQALAANTIGATEGSRSYKRLNTRFYLSGLGETVWSPQTDLYLDQAATQPYVGGNAKKVYFKSNQIGSYSYAVVLTPPNQCTVNLTTVVNTIVVDEPIVLDQTFCDETDVTDIVVTGVTTGAILRWYDALTSTTEITSITTSGTYYVEQVLNNCASSRTGVELSINGIADLPTADASQVFCGNSTVQDLVATPLTGNTIGWFTSQTSTTPLSTTTELSNGIYYVAQFNGFCWSPKVEVSVTINPQPADLIVVDQNFCGVHTLAEVEITLINNATINWYETQTSTLVLPLTTVISSGTYYVSQTLNGCESVRVPLAITVQDQLPAPVAASTQLFCGTATIADLQVTASPGGDISWFATETSTTALLDNQNVVTGTYYVAQFNGVCWSDRTSVQVAVNAIPDAPGNSSVNLCGSYTLGQISLGQAQNATLNWYATPISTPALPLTTTVETGVYYVSQTIGGCESERVLINISQTESLPLPVVSSQSFCGSKTVADLEAEAVVGATIVWYNSAISPTPLSSSTMITTGTYYVAQTKNGCESDRAAVSVIITTVTGPIVSPFTFCGSAFVSDLYIPSATGVVYKWYNSPTSSQELTSDTPLVSGMYFVSRSQNGCESSRTSVSVTINSLPDAPTGVTPQVFIEGSVINDIIMDQTNVTWYITAEDAQNGVNPLSPQLPLVNGTTYYGVIIGTNGCPSLPFELTVDVYLSNDEFVKNDLKFYPNPVQDVLNITYSERILQIEVFDLLGKRIKSIAANDNDVNVDLSDLSSGTYMIQLKTISKSQFIKVVKK